MELDKLTTPYTRRRTLQYASDGNTVVKHWHDVQQITGPFYKTRVGPDEYGKPCCDICLFFDGLTDGLMLEKSIQMDWYTVEESAARLRRTYPDSLPAFFKGLDDSMEADKHIAMSEILFVAQADPERAKKYLAYRKDRMERRRRQEEERLKRKAQEEAERLAAEKAAKAEEDAAARAKYLGWADDLTARYFAKADEFLSRFYRYSANYAVPGGASAERIVLTRRDFLIGLIRAGWKPGIHEGVVNYHKVDGEYRPTKPRTVYDIAIDGIGYTLTKTEYEFAAYLAAHPERLVSGTEEKTA